MHVLTTAPPSPQVTDVLNLGIVGSAADYVHRAGRVGRVGLARAN
jgi:superfamily II DNA/RNA helicase